MPRSSVLVRLLVATSLTAGAWTAAPVAQAESGPLAAVALSKPARPTGLVPATSDPLPVLAWQPALRAASYQVDVATDSQFQRVVWEVDTTNRRATPTEALPSGRLYWRVRSLNGSGASAWTNATITIQSTTGPGLLSPAEAEVLQQPQGVPLLQWTAVASAESYEVQVDDEMGFVGAETAVVRTTSFLRRDPQTPGTTYYWRVRATVDGRVTGWSAIRSYRVAGLRWPALVAPAMANETSFPVVTDVVLEWTPVTGATRYDIRISPDREFNTGLVTADTVSTRYSPPVTLGNDNYFWQVRPVGNDGKFATWDTVPRWQFQRSWALQPDLEWPVESGSVADPVFYQWSAVRNASSYQLQVSTDENFSPVNVTDCYTELTTLTPATAGCLPRVDRPTYWRVRALDAPAGVNGLWSEIEQFTYRPEGVQLTAPSNGATVTTPSLSWEHLSGATSYTVHIKDAARLEQSYLTYATSFTVPALDPAAGPFTWHVQANYSSGASTSIPMFFSRSFTLAPPSTTTGSAPNPLTPSASSVNYRPPALTWSPVADAESYRVWMSAPNSETGDYLSDTYAFPAATDAGDLHLSAGTYTWFVEARRTDGSVVYGAPSTFAISRPRAVTGQGVAITGTGLDGTDRCTAVLGATPSICTGQIGTPVLTWSPVPEASYYELYLSRDKELTNLVFEPLSVNATRWAGISQLGDSQAGEAYFWTVRPCVSTTACAAPPRTATHAFDKRSVPVGGLRPGTAVDGNSGQPAGAVPVVGDQLTFEWDDYLATNAAATNLFSLERGRQEASTYQVQVATDRNFGAVIDGAEVDQHTYTAYSMRYPEGLLYWRVRAIDSSGNVLPWSRTLVVEKRTPGPDLTSPANGAAVGVNQALRWSPAAGVQRYHIEIYNNGDQLFSPANLVVSDSSGHAAYSPEYPLAVSSKAYVWRVRREDASGNLGQWSTARTFTVTGNASSLIAPQSGGNVTPRAALFSWSTAPGATDYLLQVRGARSMASVFDVTTSGQAWAPSTTMGKGTYLWRVITVDSSGAHMKSTAWRKFTVG